MACTPTLSAYKRGCKVTGGITDIWINDKETRIDGGITYTILNGALTIAGGGAIAAYHIEPRENNTTFTQPRSDDNTAGTTFVTQTLEFTLVGYSAALAYLSDEIGKGRIEALMKFDDGTYVMAGIEVNGLQSNGGDAGFSGTAKADANGQSYTLTCESKLTAPTLADFSEYTTAFTVNEGS